MARSSTAAAAHSTKTLSISKCDHLGEPQITYPGRLVYADEAIAVIRCVWHMQRSYQYQTFSITKGDILVEIYYAHRWYNVFAVYTPTGILKGWYCNITYPASLENDTLAWRDLALDLLVLPNGDQHILDEQEFITLNIPSHVRLEATNAMTQLQDMAHAHTWPLVSKT